jgi:hypothetical protein
MIQPSPSCHTVALAPACGHWAGDVLRVIALPVVELKLSSDCIGMKTMRTKPTSTIRHSTYHSLPSCAEGVTRTDNLAVYTPWSVWMNTRNRLGRQAKVKWLFINRKSNPQLQPCGRNWGLGASPSPAIDPMNDYFLPFPASWIRAKARPLRKRSRRPRYSEQYCPLDCH